MFCLPERLCTTWVKGKYKPEMGNQFPETALWTVVSSHVGAENETLVF